MLLSAYRELEGKIPPETKKRLHEWGFILSDYNPSGNSFAFTSHKDHQEQTNPRLKFCTAQNQYWLVIQDLNFQHSSKTLVDYCAEEGIALVKTDPRTQGIDTKGWMHSWFTQPFFSTKPASLTTALDHYHRIKGFINAAESATEA